jgi:hypothetical protein
VIHPVRGEDDQPLDPAWSFTAKKGSIWVQKDRLGRKPSPWIVKSVLGGFMRHAGVYAPGSIERFIDAFN